MVNRLFAHRSRYRYQVEGMSQAVNATRLHSRRVVVFKHGNRSIDQLSRVLFVGSESRLRSKKVMNQLPMVKAEPSVSCCRWSPQMSGFCFGIVLTAVAVGAYWAGKGSLSNSNVGDANSVAARFVPPEYLNAAATHGSSNLAVCTGQVDEDAEGFFVLDYLTGELKAWVYYPRAGTFGGYFVTNVQPVLGVNKNPEYLLVTGNALTIGQSSNVRPAQTLVYVVDARSGFFAAFVIPWNRTMANSNSPQNGTFTMVGGGQIREPQGGAKKPINPPKAPGPGGAVGAAPGNNVGGAAPGPQPPAPGKQP